jgi:hypothetical protein
MRNGSDGEGFPIPARGSEPIHTKIGFDPFAEQANEHSALIAENSTGKAS